MALMLPLVGTETSVCRRMGSQMSGARNSALVTQRSDVSARNSALVT
jgi:hypothetical protein